MNECPILAHVGSPVNQSSGKSKLGVRVGLDIRKLAKTSLRLELLGVRATISLCIFRLQRETDACTHIRTIRRPASEHLLIQSRSQIQTRLPTYPILGVVSWYRSKDLSHKRDQFIHSTCSQLLNHHPARRRNPHHSNAQKEHCSTI